MQPKFFDKHNTSNGIMVDWFSPRSAFHRIVKCVFRLNIVCLPVVKMRDQHRCVHAYVVAHVLTMPALYCSGPFSRQNRSHTIGRWRNVDSYDRRKLQFSFGNSADNRYTWNVLVHTFFCHFFCFGSFSFPLSAIASVPSIPLTRRLYGTLEGSS